jgi:hypothetical protein
MNQLQQQQRQTDAMIQNMLQQSERSNQAMMRLLLGGR